MRSKIYLEQEFSPVYYRVKGNKEFEKYCKLFERVDQILNDTRLDLEFAETYVKWLEKKYGKELKGKRLTKNIEYAVEAFRCNIVRSLLNDISFSKLSLRIAESMVLQRFIGRLKLGEYVEVPKRSLLHKYSQILPKKVIEDFVSRVNGYLSATPSELKLKERLKTEEIFVDSCAIEAWVHFPVDWVLLRDAVRTLIKIILRIRRHGLRHRMSRPENFLKQINRECIAMSNSRRRKDARKERKKIFRRMKNICQIVKNHAIRYYNLLQNRWQETDLTKKEMEQICLSIDKVLKKLPKAIRQAHKRIIRGEHTENKDKILSLYDDDVNVIVRGKDKCEVEFGNSLYLAEQRDGFIVDWQLYQKDAPSDSKKLLDSLERLKKLNISVKSIAGDRGFDSSIIREKLSKEFPPIYNAICPRNKEDLLNKEKEEKFKIMQKRRSQTEARISILRNGFIGNPSSGRSFEQRSKDVAWAVLTHNLWVLARLPVEEVKKEKLKKAG